MTEKSKGNLVMGCLIIGIAVMLLSVSKVLEYRYSTNLSPHVERVYAPTVTLLPLPTGLGAGVLTVWDLGRVCGYELTLDDKTTYSFTPKQFGGVCQ